MKLENNKEYELAEVIYYGRCNKCGEVLEFECNFDADGSTYSAYCCGLLYYAVPCIYKVTVEEGEEEE